jgi:hypothetical protein
LVGRPGCIIVIGKFWNDPGRGEGEGICGKAGVVKRNLGLISVCHDADL